jgi:heat shock protein HslJ
MMLMGVQQSCDYITGEKPASESMGVRLGGTQWKVTSINNVALLRDSYIYFQFNDDSSFWACAGVNFAEGKYSVSENSALSFTGGIYTMIGIFDQALIDQEKDFGHALETVSSWSFNGNSLEMKNSAGMSVLGFEQLPEYTMNPVDLIRTKWRLNQVNGIPVPPEVSVRFSFTGDNRAVSKAGEYTTDIKYSAMGDNLMITQMRVAIHNPKDLFELEDSERTNIDYAWKIYAVVCYRLRPDKLEFFTFRGDTLVFLRE